jgi:hypothetical protein
VAIAALLRPFPHWLNVSTRVALFGTILGMGLGRFVYAPLITQTQLQGDTLFYEKFFAVNARLGIGYGALIGGSVGFLFEVARWYLARRRAKAATQRKLSTMG